MISLIIITTAVLGGLAMFLRPRNTSLFRVFKILAISSLFIFALFSNPEDSNPYLFIGIAAGIFFSMVGDALKALDDERGNMFIPCMIFFAVAHICYSGSFLIDVIMGGPSQFLIIFSIFMGLVILFISAMLVRSLKVKRNKTYVKVYCGIISFMVTCSFATMEPILLMGALLFYLSDIVLAIDRFGTPLKHYNILNLLPYYAGQTLFVVALYVL